MSVCVCVCVYIYIIIAKQLHNLCLSFPVHLMTHVLFMPNMLVLQNMMLLRLGLGFRRSAKTECRTEEMDRSIKKMKDRMGRREEGK